MILKSFFDASGHKLNPGQFFFGGQKAPKAPKQEKIKFPEQPQIAPPAPIQLPPPPAPAPPPPPIPPAPTASKMEVQQASDDQRKQAAKRKGSKQTLIAGETGGYLGSSMDPSKKTLLGG